MGDVFRISQKHYAIITKQAADNFPREAGGFLGGKDNTIKAILPIYNKQETSMIDTFGFLGEDIERAHRFFKKHNLDYYGLYHTHPSGVAYPSKKDIDTGHRYHFIIGIPESDASRADFRAYEIIKKQPIHIPIEIVSDSEFSTIDIHSGQKIDANTPRSILDDASELESKLDRIRNENPHYDKNDPVDPYNSGFSTLA